MPQKIYLFNWEIEQEKDISLSFLERGFLFGDGIFETIISRNYCLFRFSQHYERMKKGAEICNFQITKKNVIEKSIVKCLKKFGIKNGYIRINIWRQKGEGINPEGTETNSLVIIKNFVSYPLSFYEQGMNCIISKKIIRNENSPLTRIKSLNFLENVIGKIEAKENNCDETIFLNNKKFLTEATVSNVFLVQKDKVYTPSLICGILDGITRKVVIEICKENNIEIKEGEFVSEFLVDCDEVFLTNSLMNVMPVKTIRSLSKRNKSEITNFIRNEYLKILKEETIS